MLRKQTQRYQDKNLPDHSIFEPTPSDGEKGLLRNKKELHAGLCRSAKEALLSVPPRQSQENPSTGINYDALASGDATESGFGVSQTIARKHLLLYVASFNLETIYSSLHAHEYMFVDRAEKIKKLERLKEQYAPYFRGKDHPPEAGRSILKQMVDGINAIVRINEKQLQEHFTGTLCPAIKELRYVMQQLGQITDADSGEIQSISHDLHTITPWLLQYQMVEAFEEDIPTPYRLRCTETLSF